MRAQPNDWHSEVSSAAKNSSQAGGKDAAYTAFWTIFLKRVHLEHPDWTHAQKPTNVNWMNVVAPIKGTSYGFSFAMGGKTRVELYIDTGSESENKSIYDQLRAKKDEIEATFGGPLSWEELPGRRHAVSPSTEWETPRVSRPTMRTSTGSSRTEPSSERRW